MFLEYVLVACEENYQFEKRASKEYMAVHINYEFEVTLSKTGLSNLLSRKATFTFRSKTEGHLSVA